MLLLLLFWLLLLLLNYITTTTTATTFSSATTSSSTVDCYSVSAHQQSNAYFTLSHLCNNWPRKSQSWRKQKKKRCHQEQQGNKQIDCCWERQVVGCSSFAEPASIFRHLARHYVLQLGFVFVCLALSVLVLVFVFVLRSSSVFIRCCGYFAHYCPQSFSGGGLYSK